MASALCRRGPAVAAGRLAALSCSRTLGAAAACLVVVDKVEGADAAHALAIRLLAAVLAPFFLPLGREETEERRRRRKGKREGQKRRRRRGGRGRGRKHAAAAAGPQLLAPTPRSSSAENWPRSPEVHRAPSSDGSRPLAGAGPPRRRGQRRNGRTQFASLTSASPSLPPPLPPWWPLFFSPTAAFIASLLLLLLILLLPRGPLEAGPRMPRRRRRPAAPRRRGPQPAGGGEAPRAGRAFGDVRGAGGDLAALLASTAGAGAGAGGDRASSSAAAAQAAAERGLGPRGVSEACGAFPSLLAREERRAGAGRQARARDCLSLACAAERADRALALALALGDQGSLDVITEAHPLLWADFLRAAASAAGRGARLPPRVAAAADEAAAAVEARSRKQ